MGRHGLSGVVQPAHLRREKIGAAANIDALEALPASGPGTSPHLLVEIRKCGSCTQTLTAQVKQISFKTDDKGEVSEERNDIGEIRLISVEQFDRLSAMARRPPL